MSFILSTIKQVRFLVYDCAFGTVQIVVNRPGNTALTQAAADTLVLSRVTDETNGDYSPYLQGDVPLSKKFITTKGRRALDDITINMRDSLGYSGSVNSVDTAENFANGTSTAGAQTPVYATFFDMFFDEPEEYKAWILYEDAEPAVPIVDVCGGSIDPSYSPISDSSILNPGTAQQIFLGSRTIKIVNLKNVTWGDVLALIAESDTVTGTPYLGFMLAPPGCGGKTDSRGHIFPSSTSNKGNWYLAVPHGHIYNGNDPRVLRCIDAPVWPDAPFSGLSSTRIWGATVYNHATWSLPAHGYAHGDTGVILGGTVNGTYKVYNGNLIINGAPGVLTPNGGSGYAVGQICNTTVTTGGGDGTLQLLVEGLSGGASWGPSGYVFISLGTLFAKIALAQGQNTFTPSTDLASALSWWKQKADNAKKCFPVDTSAEIPLDEIYVNLNVLGRSHPYDGSLWENPIGPAPEAPIADVLTAVCNLLLSDYNFLFQSDGTSNLTLKAMGVTDATLPAWPIIGTPGQEDPSSGPRSVAVHNRGDDLKIQAPYKALGDIADIEVPFRIKPIGSTFSRSNSDASVDNNAIQFDTKITPQETADKCLKVYWQDGSDPSLTKYVINPDVWKSLCFLFWQDTTSPANSPVYPTNWSPFPNSDGTDGSWHNALYVVNAVFKGGDTPNADLMNQNRGGEYFDTRSYHAVAFGTLSIDLPSVQSFSYAGVADPTGSIQNIAAGLPGQWCYKGNPSQNWRAIELTQQIVSGITDIKWQAQSNSGAFPNLTDLVTGQIEGGSNTSSSAGGNSTSGGVPSNVTGGHFQPDSIVTLTGVLPQITTLDVYYLCNDATTTGVLAPATPAASQTLVITNKTGTSFRAGNFHIPNGATRTFIYDGTNTPSDDATLPNGWNHLDR